MGDARERSGRELLGHSPGGEEWPGDLGWTLGALFRSYLHAAGAVAGELPGGARGFQVLTAAAHELPESQGALARELGIDRTVMTYLVDDLEIAGYVERRSDPGDRRNKHLVATRAGLATWSRVREELEAAEERLLGALDPEERASFRAMLHKLANHRLVPRAPVTAAMGSGLAPGKTKPPGS